MYPEVQIIRRGHQSVDQLHACHLITKKTKKREISQPVNISLLMTKELIEWREPEFSFCVFIGRYAVEESLCVHVGVRVCNKVRGNSS